MKGRYLISSNESPVEGNVYSDKAALILDWLLRIGISKGNFSLRDVVKDVGISIGLVQRVFHILALRGLLQAKGVRTAKSFFFNKPRQLLESWLEHYSILKKCKIRTYHSALSEKSEWFRALKQSGLDQSVAIALHSAAEAHGYKNTSLHGLELYVLDPSIREKVESVLQLEPQERGYEVLLVEPYYKTLIKKSLEGDEDIAACPLLLTFLDLYHFPLRGQEQAEFIAQRAPEMTRIYSVGKNK